MAEKYHIFVEGVHETLKSEEEVVHYIETNSIDYSMTVADWIDSNDVVIIRGTEVIYSPPTTKATLKEYK